MKAIAAEYFAPKTRAAATLAAAQFAQTEDCHEPEIQRRKLVGLLYVAPALVFVICFTVCAFRANAVDVAAQLVADRTGQKFIGFSNFIEGVQ